MIPATEVEVVWKGEQEFAGHSRQSESRSVETSIDGKRISAPSPMELLLEALGGCMGIDVVLILRKMRQPLEGLKVRLQGERREEEPKKFTSVRITFDVTGQGIEREKVSRALALSIEKYCSVFHSLDRGIGVTTEILLNPPG